MSKVREEIRSDPSITTERLPATMASEDIPINERLEPVDMRMVALSEINIDWSYYRPPNETAIERMVRVGFDPYAAGAITLHQRPDGRLFLLDGDHRFETADRRKLKKIAAIIYNGLTPEREALEFERIQVSRSVTTPGERLKAQVRRGYLPALTLVKIVEENGYQVSYAASASSDPDVINAVASLQQVLAYGGQGALDTVLKMTRGAWSGIPGATMGFLLKALYMLHWKHRNEYDQKRLIEQLRTLRPEDIRRRARSKAYEMGTGGNTINTYRVLVDLYNERGGKRLTYKGGLSPQIGEDNPASKLTNEQAREIYALYSTERFSVRDLANRFGVSATTILGVVRGERYGNLATEPADTIHGAVDVPNLLANV